MKTHLRHLLVLLSIACAAVLHAPPALALNPPPVEGEGPQPPGKDPEDEDCGEDPESTCKPCEESNATDTDNKCLHFRQVFGRSPWISGSTKGALVVYETDLEMRGGQTFGPPTQEQLDRLGYLGRPSMFRYDHVMLRKIINRDAFLKEITIEDPLGRQTVYRDGKPVQAASGRNRQCREGAGGTVVEMLADRTKIFYSSDGEVFQVESPDGVVATRAELGIAIVRRQGDIRQVWSKADGLMDIVPLEERKVRVSWYASSSVSGSVGPSGLYTVYGEPFKTFTFTGGTAFKIDVDTSTAGSMENRVYTLWAMFEGLNLLENYPSKAQVFSHAWTYNYRERDWVFTKGGSLVTNMVTEKYSEGVSTVTKKIENASGVSLHQVERYRNDVNGARLVERKVVSADGRLTVQFFARRIELGSNAGRPSSVKDARGNVSQYTYDGEGRVTQKVERVRGDLQQSTVHEYAATEEGGFTDRRPRRSVGTCAGVVLSDTMYSYGAAGPSGMTLDTVIRRDPATGAELRTLRFRYSPSGPAPDIKRGRLALTVEPDGSATLYGYQPDGNGGWTETAQTGYWNPEEPTQTPGFFFHTVPGQSVLKADTYDCSGNLVYREHHVHTGFDFSLSGWESAGYDAMHKKIVSETSEGEMETADWIDSELLWKRNADGSCVTNTFDPAKRVATSTRNSPFGSVKTAYAYDASNRERFRTVSTNGVFCHTETREYDAAGRLVRHTDPAGRVTSTAYSPDSLTVTRTDPAGAVTVTVHNPDGSLHSVTGTASVARFHTYGVNPADGTGWERVSYGSPDSPSRDTRHSNALGQLVRSERPAFGGGALTTFYTYNDAGQLVAEQTPGEPLVEYGYAYGTSLTGGGCGSCVSGGGKTGDRVAVIRTADGISRTSLTLSSFAEEPDGSVWEVTDSVQACSDPALPALTNTVARKLFPLDPGLASETVETDPRGNVTLTQSSYDTNTCTRVTAVTAPHAAALALTVATDGLTVMTVSQAAVTNTYAYDALRRQVFATDGRGNTRAFLYNALGQVAAAADYLGVPQLLTINSLLLTNLTSYAYDAAGRRISVTDPLGHTVHTAYDPAGRVAATWGATYPVAYEYDASGRMTALYTTRDSGFDISSVTNSSFLPPNSSLDVTRWLYDQPTGLLTNKLYADNTGPAYTYTPAGKLATRAWARGVTTSYTHDPFGQPLSVEYSDATPPVSFAYDALGRLTSVTDASGVRTVTHTPDGLPLADTLAAAGSIFTLAEKYDIFGRSEGYALSNMTAGADALIAETMQTYDTDGGLERVAVSGAGEFAYARLPGSDLVQSLAMPNGVTRETVFDPLRDQPVSVTHTNAAGTVLARRTFAYDAAGRLTNRTQYRLGDDTDRLDAFGYNPRSELTSAALGANAYANTFDPIGNRIVTTENTEITEYLANNLNQYTNILCASASLRLNYDLDGNQTLIRTATGIWHVTYNAENRPVVFSNDTAVIEMAYDHQGRRFEYKETVNNTLARHERYLYRGYLQLAAFDLLNAPNAQPRLSRTLAWDPIEPVATRPLCITFPLPLGEGQGEGMYTYAFDQVKNVTELFDSTGNIAATYDYAPFGAVTESTGSAVAVNPLTFSSEIADTSLALQYYNYRHLNTLDGRWINRDPIWERSFHEMLELLFQEFPFSSNYNDRSSYRFIANMSIMRMDRYGLLSDAAACAQELVKAPDANGLLICNDGKHVICVRDTELNRKFPKMKVCTDQHEEVHKQSFDQKQPCDPCGTYAPRYQSEDEKNEEECWAYLASTRCLIKAMEDDCGKRYNPNSHVADENLSDCARAYVWVIYNERNRMNSHCDEFLYGKR